MFSRKAPRDSSENAVASAAYRKRKKLLYALEVMTKWSLVLFTMKSRDSSKGELRPTVRPGSVDCPVVRVESSFRENSMVIVKNEEWKYVNELETMVSEDVEC